MRNLALVSVGLAGLLHVGFFLMESVWWRRPAIHRRFGIRSQEEADLNAFALYNQGFYNLGLGIGAFVGIGLDLADNASGGPIIVFASAIMLLASIVLVSARKALAPAAAVQGLPPLIAILALLAS
ncbi:MAG TPA: DUF1304 domain-containing protein [Actinobacteria bacterium]|nr:DUF1304 domain-containing protein [Actinomycetota bacterium]